MSEQKIKLPSGGKFGGPSEVTIRNLTGADEKILYSGLSEETMDKVISRCVIEPTDFKAADLCEQDKYYILIQIRILTFGNDYSYEVPCPECGKKMAVTVDLDALDIAYADEDFDDVLKCTLPCGDEIVMKVLTTKDIREVNMYLAKIKKQNDKGATLLLRQASIIESINGEKKSLTERLKYVEDSSSKDLNYLWRQYAKINLGVNMRTIVDCPYCGQTVEVPVVMNAEFFRPSVDD